MFLVKVVSLAAAVVLISFSLASGAYVIYDPLTSMCCKSSVLPMAGLNIDCCNGVKYSTLKALCCNGLVAAIPSTGARTPACCGSLVYDSSTSICCGGVIRPKPLSTDCCGAVPYNTVNQICCNGVVQTKPFPTAASNCCGTVAYDPNRQVCCGPKNVLVPTNGVSNPACCGTTVYDSSKFKCCS